MYEDEVIVEEVVETWEDTISKEDAADVARLNLTPKGKYVGVYHSHRSEIVESRDPERPNPFAGKRVVNIRFTLSDGERNYAAFVEAYPAVVKVKRDDGGEYVALASQNATMLYDALEMHGAKFEDVLARLADGAPLLFTVSQSKPKDPTRKPRNTYKISAYKG